MTSSQSSSNEGLLGSAGSMSEKEPTLSDSSDNDDGERLIDVVLNDVAPSAEGKQFTKLYFSHTFSSFGERMWEFSVPLLFETIFPFTLFPAALFLFCISLATFGSGTMIGNWVDRGNRLTVLRYSLSISNVSLIGVSASLYILNSRYGQKGLTELPWYDPIFILLMIVINVLGAISEVYSMAEMIAATRDWPRVMSGSNTDQLTDANAMIVRINLMSKICTPLLVGVLLEMVAVKWAIMIIASWNLFSYLPEVTLYTQVYNKVEALQAANTHARAKEHWLLELKEGWTQYYRQDIFLASLSYVCLYFTILSPGGIMNAWLLQQEVPAWGIGIYQAASAVFGFASTFIAPRLIKRWGTHRTAVVSALWQESCLVVAVIGYFLFVNSEIEAMIGVFLLFLVASRQGLWGFDLAERQIMQEEVDPEHQGAVFGVETALTKLASLLIYAQTVAFSEHFFVMVVSSFAAVTLTCVFINIWNRKTPNYRQKIEMT